jgi:cbb3-type cytochrome oxidase subunit 3
MLKMIKTIFLITIVCLSIAATAQAGFLSNAKKAEVNNNINAISSSTYPTKASSVDNIIASAIEIILSFLGMIFVVLILISGVNWMTAHGNEEKVTKAKDAILNLVIGLILVLAAFAITYMISNVFSNKLLN